MSTAQAIKSPVGRRGLNKDGDVRIIQRLLNNAIGRESKLTGLEELSVDGDCGPKTIAAIETYQQKVLGWTGSYVDGTVEPNRTTWRSLNGNVESSVQIQPVVAPAAPAPSDTAAQADTYKHFKQGDSTWGQTKIGNSTTKTIAGIGCAMTTLTMAATHLGSRTEHWPDDLQPSDLTPAKSNEILKKAGAFDGGSLIMSKAAEALGMGYEEYGRNGDLAESDVTKIDNHLATNRPVAGHVDYKDSTTAADSAGDHWILITTRNGDGTYTAIDPATGKTMLLTSGQNMTVDNSRYQTTKDDRKGVLFGYANSGGSASQQKYIVVRFALLSSGG